ncbi:unnamed protein product, partial [Closterium sp. NIES-54]
VPRFRPSYLLSCFSCPHDPFNDPSLSPHPLIAAPVSRPPPPPPPPPLPLRGQLNAPLSTPLVPPRHGPHSDPVAALLHGPVTPYGHAVPSHPAARLLRAQPCLPVRPITTCRARRASAMRLVPRPVAPCRALSRPTVACRTLLLPAAPCGCACRRRRACSCDLGFHSARLPLIVFSSACGCPLSSAAVIVDGHWPRTRLGEAFPDAIELPRWHDLLMQNVPIFDLDFDAILAAMYALSDSAEGDCYLSVPPDPGIAAAALGASASAAPGAGESALSGTAPHEALHTFTLDSGASRSFFRDNTTLTPLSRPVAVSLADPSRGPVLAHSSTVLPCPAAPSGLLSGLHLPSFSTNLVSGADLQDAWVDQFAPGGQRVIHCTCSRTGRHRATFTRRPGSSLYTQTTAPPPVSASSQVAASSQVFAAASRSSPASAPCSCCPLSHETLLWHHRLGHPSLPPLRGMASRTLVSGLPRSLPPLPPGPAPTCVPCVEGRHRAAPHSSTFPLTEAPLQTLHMDVWGPARVRGQGHERYFLLVIDDYSRYTTVFPLRSKGEVPEVLIDWIRGARRQLSECFGSDLPVLRLHSDRGGEFSFDLLRAYCRAEGIRQTFTLPASPQQNGIAERRIGMVMDVARTSMIHAAAPHFLWPFAVQYAAHQINLQPRVSLPETTPALRWTGKVGDASAFRVWGS